jgi:cyanophycinase
VEHFVTLAGGAGRARIVVIPLASAEPSATGEEKAEQLRGLGARAFNLIVTRQEADADSTVRMLDSATGVWFTGGDQARITAVLTDTRLLQALRERHRAGAVIAGTSAGAAIMSDSMITGDQRRAGEDTVGYFGDEYPAVARGTIEVEPGLGFLPGTIVDQHFLRRERHNRLLSATLERPQLIGVGIDEGTALQVNADGGWEVHGRSAVVIYDARRALITDAAAPVLGAAEVRTYVLPAGSTYDPVAGRAVLPAGAP